MATEGALITTAITYADNIDANDADNSDRRARALVYLQTVWDRVWGYRDWRWKVTMDTLTIPAGSVGSPSAIAVPSDFSDIGTNGGVYSVTSGRRLKEVFAQQIIDDEASLHTYSEPEEFCLIGDYDNSRILLRTRNLASSYQVRIYYNTIPPTLTDTTNPTDAMLTKMPAQYHNTVLLAGLVWQLNRSKGDTRQWQADYEAGLANMIAAEVPRHSSVQRLPPAIYQGW